MSERGILEAVARADVWLCAAWAHIRLVLGLCIAAAILKGVRRL